MPRALFSLAAVVVGIAASAQAQVTRSPEYLSAQAIFDNRVPFKARVISQVLLIATGHQNSVPTERYSGRTFEALTRFQIENGLYPNGQFDDATETKLSKLGREKLDFWNFSVVTHPTTGVSIWMPQGMGLHPSPNKNGLSYEDPQKRVFVSYNAFPNTDVYQAYEYLKAKMIREGTKINYSVAKDGWYVISASSANGNDQYMRYHQFGNTVTGFSIFWNNNNGVVNGERIAILMSASLGSSLNGRPMVEPPGMGSGVTNVAKAEIPSSQSNSEFTPLNVPLNPVVPSTPPAPAPPVAPKAEDKGISSGSGFFVDAKSNFITNAHVVKGCNVVIVKLNDGKEFHKARIVASDTNNDLALLSVEDTAGHKFSPLRIGVRLGEGVAAFGYPHADVLASAGNFTLGNITALAGIGDDSRYFQMQTPVQSGNSGGPLLDNYGNVVGVVSNKLNVLKMASATGDMPQNVNFALKGSTLVQFLEANSVSVTIGSVSQMKNDPADVAEDAKAVSGFVACQ